MRWRRNSFWLMMAAWLVPLAADGQSGGLKYEDASLRAFIEDVAFETRKTFILGPKVRGKVNVFSPQAVSADELFEILQSVLKVNAFALSQIGTDKYKVDELEDSVRDAPLADTAQGDSYVTRIFTLRHVAAKFAHDALRKNISSNGRIFASARAQRLIITDFAANMARLAKIIAQLDVDKSQTITLKLKNLGVAEVSDIIKRVSGLDGAKPQRGRVRIAGLQNGNLLILRGEPRLLKRYVAMIKQIDAQSGDLSDVRVYHLRHTDAAAMLEALSALRMRQGNAKAAPPSGISAFTGQNAIIVNGDQSMQRYVSAVISALDVPRAQVLVEAIIVEVSDNASRELGLQFVLAGGGNNSVPFTVNRYASTAPDILATTGAIMANRSDSVDSSVSSLLRRATIDSFLRTDGLLIGGGGRRSDGSVFGAVLNALSRDVKSNILSTPSIMTLDNERATFLVGQEIPITTGEALGSSNDNPFRTIARKNIGIQLEVVPQINDDNDVRLRIKQEVSALAGVLGAEAGEPITTKREMATTVRVRDGEVIVLGGLIKKDERVSAGRIPILGDIPILGRLFGASGRARETTNLMVFLRPTIIRTAADARAVTAERRRGFSGRDFADITKISLDDVLPATEEE